MKLSEASNMELYRLYNEYDEKLKSAKIISQSNPGPILEFRYYKREQGKVYQELIDRHKKKNGSNIEVKDDSS